MPLTYRFLVVLAVVVVLGACASSDLILKPGWRHIVITFENLSARPVTFVVAHDGPVMGELVGTADPASVPPGTTMDVTFGLPPEPGWGIFVNPGAEQLLLLNERIVPADATGPAPFQFIDNDLIGQSDGAIPLRSRRDHEEVGANAVKKRLAR